MIEVTNEAYSKLVQKALLQENFVFRLGITGGGCGGMEYIFAYNDKSFSSDTVIDWGEIRFRIDHNSVSYLKGFTLDYKVEGLNESFVFINPNETYRCGCGESVVF